MSAAIGGKADSSRTLRKRQGSLNPHQLFFFVHAFFIHRLSEAANQCTSEQTSVYSRQHLLQVCKELLPPLAWWVTALRT
jgi:hypothetical protein